jgi:hypothetical protein
VKWWRWPWERGNREEPGSQPELEASEPVVPTEDPYPVITEQPNSGGTGGGEEAVHGVVQVVHQGCSGQPDDRSEASEVTRNTGRCTTCLVLTWKSSTPCAARARRFGSSHLSMVLMLHLCATLSTVVLAAEPGSNVKQVPISENRRGPTAETPPEGADPSSGNSVSSGRSLRTRWRMRRGRAISQLQPPSCDQPMPCWNCSLRSRRRRPRRSRRNKPR